MKTVGGSFPAFGIRPKILRIEPKFERIRFNSTNRFASHEVQTMDEQKISDRFLDPPHAMTDSIRSNLSRVRLAKFVLTVLATKPWHFRPKPPHRQFVWL
jgi:hypothetical protein